MPSAHPNRRPLLALVLLSPVIAEMLSGCSPPLEWLNPITPLLLIWLYGAGILVMRETAVRWRTGWPSILLLGAAYGIIEEGLAVKSFFDPGWMDLGTLAWYGRWLDVNWVWAVWLTIYHAVVSIAIPIFLTEWIWPRIRSQPLTSRRGYITAIGLLAGATVFINLFLTPYRPSVCTSWARQPRSCSSRGPRRSTLERSGPVCLRHDFPDRPVCMRSRASVSWWARSFSTAADRSSVSCPSSRCSKVLPSWWG